MKTKQMLTLMTLTLLIGLLASPTIAQTDLQNQGSQTSVHNWHNVPGVDGSGGTVRNGEDFFQEGEAHGPQDGDANKLFIDLFIDEDGDGFDDAFQLAIELGGETGRGEGQGSGECLDEGTQAMTQTMTQTMAGELNQHSWGSGEGSFGPGQSSGNGGSGSADGGSGADQDPIRSRGGRR